jgi:hypothetical protein
MCRPRRARAGTGDAPTIISWSRSPSVAVVASRPRQGQAKYPWTWRRAAAGPVGTRARRAASTGTTAPRAVGGQRASPAGRAAGYVYARPRTCDDAVNPASRFRLRGWLVVDAYAPPPRVRAAEAHAAVWPRHPRHVKAIDRELPAVNRPETDAARLGLLDRRVRRARTSPAAACLVACKLACQVVRSGRYVAAKLCVRPAVRVHGTARATSATDPRGNKDRSN